MTRKLFFLSSILITIVSCQKQLDSSEKIKASDNRFNYKRFFPGSGYSNPMIARIFDYLKTENAKQEFLPTFASIAGYPRWDKTIFKNDTLCVIPLATDNNTAITGILVAEVIKNRVTCHYTLLADYMKMGEFRTEFVYGMMHLENYVFGRTSFKVYDHSLLGEAKVVFLRKSERQQVQMANTLNDDEDPCELIEIWHDPTEEECHCSGDEYFTGRYMYSGECFGTPEYYTIPRSGGGSMTLPFLSGSGGPTLPPFLSTFTEKLAYLLDNLDMTPESMDLLTASETVVNEMYNYLSSGVSDESIGIASEHIQKLASDGDYLSFVAGYRSSSGNSLTAWWDNQTWLGNATNFHLDVSQTNNQRDRLTQAEKALIALYPVQAYVIHKNVAVARSMTTSMNLPDIVNGKQDAFRHAFFQAINMRDVHPKFGGQFSLSTVEIVSLFALAHESEVHPGLRLEVEMDMFNNNVGIRTCLFCYSQSNGFIASAIMTKLNNGELRHIKPLDLVVSPYYDADNDGVQDCNFCWNGLISTSILLPTNQ